MKNRNDHRFPAILKSVWTRHVDGQWQIHGMKGLTLKPRAGYASDYFKIESDMELMTQQPGPLMNDLMTTFGPTEYLLKQSIVPVIAWRDGDHEVKAIGTAFFVSASGYLMTAGHVIRDPHDSGYGTPRPIADNVYQMGDNLHMGVLVPIQPDERAYRMLPIERCWFWGTDKETPLLHIKPDFNYLTDIAVFKVPSNPSGGGYQPLNIAPYKLAIQDRAVAIGYGEMANIPLAPDGRIGDFKPELIVSVGKITQIFPTNHVEKEVATPGPCFEFDAQIPGKMSGSPIIVGEGIITKGIVSRSWQGEKIAYGCTIAPAMHLPLYGEQTLLEMMQTGNEGIAQVHGQGL